MKAYKRKKHFYDEPAPGSVELRVTIASILLGAMSLATSLAVFCMGAMSVNAITTAPWLVAIYAACLAPSIIVSFDGIRKPHSEFEYTEAESDICEISLCCVLLSILIFMLSG